MEDIKQHINQEYPDREGCTFGCAIATVVLLIAMAAGILLLFA